MAWARIDDNFFNHPKVYKAGKDAVIFHIAALCFSNAFLTEGFIEDALLEKIGNQAFQKRPKALADKLVEVDLWERVEGGYYIHDFLDYNHSKAEIEQIKSKKSFAGKQGGRPVKANEKQNESKTKANEKQTESHTQPIPIKDKTDVVVDSERGEVFKVYENEIGMLTPFIADSIQDAEQEYPDGWVIEAIHEAAINNGKSWKYIGAILQNWKQNGFKAPRPNQSANRKPAPQKVPAGHELDHILENTPIFAEDK